MDVRYFNEFNEKWGKTFGYQFDKRTTSIKQITQEPSRNVKSVKERHQNHFNNVRLVSVLLT